MRYCAEFGKTYSDKNVFVKKLLYWMRSDRFIGLINSSKELSFLAGHNKFSDWSEEEYKAVATGAKRDL